MKIQLYPLKSKTNQINSNKTILLSEISIMTETKPNNIIIITMNKVNNAEIAWEILLYRENRKKANRCIN